MKTKKLLSLFLLLFGGIMSTAAQTAVTVGSKVTDAGNIVSGNAYLIKYTSMTGTPYIYDAGTATPLQAPSTQNAATKACAFYFISDGNGAYKLENAYTGNYWPAPTGNQRLYPTTAANAGSWAVAISSGTATLTCENSGTTYGLDRLTPDVVGWSSRKTVEIYEISAATLSTTAVFTEFTDKDINVSATAATSLTTGTWYVMKNVGRNVYAYEKTDAHKLYNQSAAPSGSAEDNAKFLVRLLNGTDGKYYLQNGLGNFVGAIPQNTAVPTTALIEEQISIAQIGDNAGYFYLRGTTDSRILDCQEPGYPVVGWGTDAPSATNSNAAWQFFPVEFVDSWVPAIDEVYTINNTNSGCGAMMYNGSSSYVWSSGKSGTFSATDPNCQWVLVSTGTAKQYYLYNVGAGKFAIPSATSSTASWIFSSDAVAVTFITQNDGTKKIKTVTTDTYAAVSNNYNGPIINYNDAGGNFTITKVDGDQSSAATAAFNKLVDNKTAASAVPASGSDGWYIIRIKTHGTYADKYVYPATSEITYKSTNYPLTFEHGANVRPAIDDVTYYTRISNESGYYYWQMPNGKYLYGNNNKFPISTMTKSNFAMDYTNGSGFRMWGSSRYAVPYLLSSQYFIGETSSSGNAYYDIYPIDLSAAGLVAWQVLCDNAPESAQITCSRSDVKGLTAVYKNGFFFLPTGVTPESTDFTIDGATNIVTNDDNKTINISYDPDISILTKDVTTTRGYQTTGRGNENALLLRINASLIKSMTNATLTIALNDEAKSNISELYIYESDANEFISNIPSTKLATSSDFSSGTATLNLGDVTQGAHCYWLCATIKSDATLGAILTASVTGINYTSTSDSPKSMQCDLTSVGNPSRQGLKVFAMQNFVFKPATDDCKYYRIPAMILDKNGNVVVAVDRRYNSNADLGNHKIDVSVRRSTNNGASWSDQNVIAVGNTAIEARYGYGDAALARTKNGRIICLMAPGQNNFFGTDHNGEKHYNNWVSMMFSDDNGVTWKGTDDNPTQPILLTSDVFGKGTGCSIFVSSGKGLTTESGDVMFTTNIRETNGILNCYILKTSDEGETWTLIPEVAYTGTDESKLEQLNDGSILLSVRQSGARGWNVGGADGTNWSTQYRSSYISGNACNADIIYYSRGENQTRDIMLHSYINTSERESLQLAMSVDGGKSWNNVYNIQPNGSCYSTMQVLNDGTLAILYEDESYTVGNGYAINYVTITKEQIEAWYDNLLPQKYFAEAVVNTAYQTSTGCDSYGAFSGTGSGHWARTWTSNASSGIAGLTISTESGYGFDKATILGTRVMTIKPSDDGATDTYTITAPAGYVISSYSIGGAVYTSGTYRITAADGTTTGDITSTTTPTHITVNDVNAASTTFTFYGASQSNWFGFTQFVVNLAVVSKEISLNQVGDKSYSTLYLPYAIRLPENTHAYVVSSTADGRAILAEIVDVVPATTPVILENKEGATSIQCPMISNATSYSGENLLHGTLTSRTLDLSDDTNYYSLGKLNDEIGFYKFSGGTITLGAYKAYLETPASGGSVKGFALRWNDIPTGVQVPRADSSNDTFFNLAGQRVSKPMQRGLYIKDGKKVVIQ